MEYWKQLEDFPDYSVSDLGRVCRNQTGRITTNHDLGRGRGFFISLSRNGKQFERRLDRLVLITFVDIPSMYFHSKHKFEPPTPIHLDGNRYNNSIHNLAWRPRWFARRYHEQFVKGISDVYRVIDLTNGEEFESAIDAVCHHGILYEDLLLTRTYYTRPVPFIGHRFKLIPKYSYHKEF
jgi:hypothetical protein